MDEEITAITRGLERCDESAWRKFHENYYQMIFDMAVSRGIPSCDASAVVQGVYLRITRHAKPFVDSSAFKRWLFCLVRCEVIDTVRKKGRRFWLNERFQQWQALRGDDAEGVDLERLDEALSCLSEDDRSLIVSHYLDGVPQETLAKESKRTVKAVECRLARLPKRLRVRLEKSAIDSLV
jgi:RNA polymerase sigma factor (sigma-70 family)